MEIPPMTFEELNALYNLAEKHAGNLPRTGISDHSYHSEYQQNQRFWNGIVEKLEKSI